MSEWKEKLRLNLNNMAESKSLIDFESVKDLFQRKFFALSRECASGVNEFVSVYNQGDIANYKIHHYDLTLENKGHIIHIAKGNSEESINIGKVSFENGFAVFNSSKKTHYLSGEIVDALFKEAFESLLD